MAELIFYNCDATGKLNQVDENFDVFGGGCATKRVPADGDAAIFMNSASSANCEVDQEVPAAGEFASIQTTDYSGTLTLSQPINTHDLMLCTSYLLGGAPINITGRFYTTPAATDVTDYTGTFIWAGVGAEKWGEVSGPDSQYPNVQVQGSGTLTTDSNVEVLGNFTLNAGMLAGAHVISVAGNISISGGTNSFSGELRQTDNGTVAISSGQRAAHLTLGYTSKKTSTVDALTYCKKFEYGAGTVDVTSILILYPVADDPWVDGAGTVSGAGKIWWFPAASRNQGAWTTGTLDLGLLIEGGAGTTLTATGDFDFGSTALNIRCGAADTAAVDMAGFALTCGPITIGHSADAAKDGELACGEGRITCAGIAAVAAGKGGNLKFDGADIASSAPIDGTDLKCTADAAARVISGTVQDITLAAGDRLIKWGCPGKRNTVNVQDAAWNLGMMPLAA